MEKEQVEKIKVCRDTIKGLLAEVEPMNETEWEAFETLTAVHKTLRKIDLGKISQVRMNLAPQGPAQEQIELPDPRATVVHGEGSLVEHPRIEAVEELDGESGKVKLVIRTPEPDDEDQQYHIFIGESETVGYMLKATIMAALVEFGDQIPDC
ncbi:MAG: hypothetical protein Q8O55_04055, partial [Dehalococcoidales bacterium]|nr:hypothetical protein [Dehalococcoidales bacterium]